MRTLLIVIALLAAVAAPALSKAQNFRNPAITLEQIEQQKRIHHGIKNGQITRKEAHKLQKQQAKINHFKKLAKSDGKVTKREKKQITRAQRKANADIFAQANNGRVSKKDFHKGGQHKGHNRGGEGHGAKRGSHYHFHGRGKNVYKG